MMGRRWEISDLRPAKVGGAVQNPDGAVCPGIEISLFSPEALYILVYPP
ncbi:MAG: hypothetical protein HC835_21525 [Oscillatoriales cyanobacterium RM2_1_1]|nr:hypothetical protein [Oscillatoriales cyanobacterium SM2_3_0]NJO47967.1 hypothetical protein [Oscillatoriales cyanobacterium RM2_1_1]